MNVKTLLLCLIPLPALAQGFAGLGQPAEGYAVPAPGMALEFPRDHGAHPQYRVEWWYVTANLNGPDGTEYGVQWTLFRTALAPQTRPGWDDPQVWMGHAGLTTPSRHFTAQRLGRGGIGQAGVEALPFRAWIDDWHMTGTEAGISTLNLWASGPEFSYDLALRADGPQVLQGDRGYSVKSASGQASYYYSQPFYRAEGTLNLADGPVPVTGQAWLDREWSSQPLGTDQTGWDWLSLHFDTGEKLMAFQLRSAAGPYTSGTWIGPDGSAAPFRDGLLRLTPLETAAVAGRKLPVRWRAELPGRGLDVEITALNAQSWMNTLFPYWEGPVQISGSHGGRGYLEMTGYE
ncbi:putative secreted hydrolase [Rhodovulum imhoffii]|uniref:Putative secreted hydrolase n=1 Tax=Rhodovulum imhoffii TaxID=365340 RepID=A0A2T5BSW1_9RHOB|nr:lipocalin-like domain-containing protein [Rhodovulum imhoffii]MBK5933059.1 iron ABC transporter permease [Rhodovulum imhoffii]PTN02353.1 putative secreted hydrolase [Rhodovulum imhoffii]